MEFDWNRGLLPQLYENASPSTKGRLSDMVSGRGLFAKEIAMGAPKPPAPVAPTSTPISPVAPDMAERLRSARPVSPLATVRQNLPVTSAPVQALIPMQPMPALPSIAPAAPQRAGLTSFQGRPAQTPGTLSYADNPETAGMNQRQATDFNVRNLESQIAAMRSLREAQNPGIAQPQSNGGIDLQDLQRQANPFYQPGQGYGDEVLNRDRYMRQFPDSRSGRAMRQQAEMGLKQLGSQRLNNLLDNALGQQQSRQAGQTALAQVRQKMLADQQDYGLRLQDLGLNRAKFGLDARRAQDEAERAGIRDQYSNNLSALQAQKVAAENAGLEQKGSLFNALRQAPNEDARQRALADLLAWHGRQADQPFGY